MNALSFTKRIIRGPRDTLPIHRFHVGQLVRSKGALTRESISGETYRIVATLPIRDNALQYRIRSSRETHERVTDEGNLEVIVSAGKDGMALAERAFRTAHIL
ncbi:hypothetical protein GFB56_37925 [Ensifer sp. T173]|uniref:Uncharacterized protein n=1 Tax=Ensifer canadensis TaxID=555315 RepID=A0AAW4FY72_9HYPH|nr:hypothetical protein [Ensifer canadensis]MBM3096400.1 hypothetical protein [Ensifer canadensis]UBI79536.1 hypothetical protein J3R84_31760 [Ensifer canadensis]